VQVRPAYSAGMNPQEDLLRPRLGVGHLGDA
jgi:hypothetical protein